MYTKGPWKSRPSGMVVTNGHGNTFIAETITHNGPMMTAEDEGNCKLIAAAPELLEACHAALGYIEFSTTEAGIKVLDILNNAIAKAEGKL